MRIYTNKDSKRSAINPFYKRKIDKQYIQNMKSSKQHGIKTLSFLRIIMPIENEN